MKIHSLSLQSGADGRQTISARVDAVEISYEVVGAPNGLRWSYDPFLAAALVYAMEVGDRLTVAGDAPVSEALVANLQEAAGVYRQWWSYLSEPEIRAERVEADPPPENDYVGCFFSGGIDSLYSFIQRESEITHLILCLGLDIAAQETERWSRTVDHVTSFARDRGKECVLVLTNGRDPLNPQGAANNHGALLASTGMPLGFRKLLVPGTNPLSNLLPWGSHPILDPLFSNGVSQVVHDSPIPRSAKTKVIAETGIGLDSLRVCNREALYNCGVCEKCLRTRVMLDLLGVQAGSLEPLSGPGEIKGLRLHKPIEYHYWEDNLEFAVKVGRVDLQKAIEKILRNWRTREAIRQLDTDFLGGMGIRLKRALRRGG